MRECGGAKYMTDTELGGDKGSDTIILEKIGDYNYLLYVSLFKHRASPKGNLPELGFTESQAQLKLFTSGT